METQTMMAYISLYFINKCNRLDNTELQSLIRSNDKRDIYRHGLSLSKFCDSEEIEDILRGSLSLN